MATNAPNLPPAQLPGPPPAQPQPPAPPCGPWGSFFRRLGRVLVQPSSFWSSMHGEGPTIAQVMWPHAVTLVGLRAAAGFIGSVLGGARIGASLGQFATSFVAWMAMIWVFATIAGSIASARGAKAALHDALRFSAFGLTPLFLVGVLAVVPVPYVSPAAELLLMPWTFYVVALGVVPVLGVPESRAPATVGILCGVTVILWSVMPTLASLAMAAALR